MRLQRSPLLILLKKVISLRVMREQHRKVDVPFKLMTLTEAEQYWEGRLIIVCIKIFIPCKTKWQSPYFEAAGSTKLNDHDDEHVWNQFKPFFKKRIGWSLTVTSHRTGSVDYTSYHNHNNLSSYHSTQHLGDFGREENTTTPKQAQHLAGMFSSDWRLHWSHSTTIVHPLRNVSSFWDKQFGTSNSFSLAWSSYSGRYCQFLASYYAGNFREACSDQVYYPLPLLNHREEH